MKTLLSVTFFSGLLTLLRMACGFLIAKVVAIHTGPSGMAMLGQAQSLIGAMIGFVSAPVSNGLVRYTAEYNDRGHLECAPWWKASLYWSIFLLGVCIPVCVVFSEEIAKWIFSDVRYGWLVILVALISPLSVVNILVGSILNGQQQYRRFILLGMIAVIFSLGVMIALIYTMNLKGALIAAVFSSGISGIVMLVGSLNQPWLRIKYWWGHCQLDHIKKIGAYVAMAVTSALAVPISMIFVRNILVDKVGWTEAGHWQAVWKISEVYLGVITMALSTYYLPKLSSLKNSRDIIFEIKNTTKIIMPIVFSFAIVVYFLRDISISLLFTEDFRPARDLFSVQLLGDVVKILAWLYAYPMLSKGAAKWFIGSEVTFSVVFVVLAYIFIGKYGVHGANIAYLINYSLYFIFVYLNIGRVSR